MKGKNVDINTKQSGHGMTPVKLKRVDNAEAQH